MRRLLTEKDDLLLDKQQELLDKQDSLDAKDHIIGAKDHIIREQEKRIALIEEYLRLARIRRFGASSEKIPGQGDLFDEAELEAALGDVAEQLSDEDLPAKKKRSKKRQRGFSNTLPRVQIHRSLSDEEKAGASKVFYTKVKEELDIVPAQARVLEYWQEKAVFDTEQGESILVAAARAVHPLGKCTASVALLAHIITSKYADALPLYRLEGMLKRYGGSITRTTMANWIIRLDDVFRPLMHRMQQHQLKADYLQADETRVQVLKETGKAATSNSWMWLIRGGPPEQPVVWFEYDASRSSDVPERLLAEFQGVLQVDGYAGYNAICRKNGITRIGCMDHCRRKFVEASKAALSPKGKHKGTVSKADIALGKIGALYRIEAEIKDLEPEEKKAMRQERSKPVLDDLKVWLDKTITRVPKDSLTQKAMTYMLNQWATLIHYCEDGRLHISNVLAENAIRPFAVGRRNWLFSNTPRGARASATCFSLVETAKANDLEPHAYLSHVLANIATADTPEKLEALLPWNVNKTG